jgi:flagellar hook-basal body complex protein FliE
MIPPISVSQPPVISGPNEASVASNQPETGSDFMSALRTATDQVSQLQSEASMKTSTMLTGNGQDVHSAMIAVQKADLAFELMVEMRNKIVSAYQEISRIPF